MNKLEKHNRRHNHRDRIAALRVPEGAAAVVVPLWNNGLKVQKLLSKEKNCLLPNL